MYMFTIISCVVLLIVAVCPHLLLDRIQINCGQIRLSNCLYLTCQTIVKPALVSMGHLEVPVSPSSAHTSSHG